MTSIYDDVRKLYEALDQSDLKVAKETMRRLIIHGVDKTFIRDMLKTVALEKMMEHLYDEVVKEKPQE